MSLLRGKKTRRAISAWTPDGENGWRVGKGERSYFVKDIIVYLEGKTPYLKIRLNGGGEICTAAIHYNVEFRS